MFGISLHYWYKNLMLFCTGLFTHADVETPIMNEGVDYIGGSWKA
jgi:hypothetical protein